jgi:NADPH:quinone reductase-like Zn-dependent oxidoreductase
MQVVDYTACVSLYNHLSSLYAEPTGQSFDAIFDCVGNDTLFHRSPSYLRADGKFLSIAAGPFGYFKLMNWPVMLGGTPRAYISVFSAPSGDSAKEVVGWFDKSWIKEVPIDSMFGMNNALQVRK